MIERMVADYRGAYGFGVFCLRYFNAAGADAKAGIGELRKKETAGDDDGGFRRVRG
jgi:UDP-glucose 4-epimerase